MVRYFADRYGVWYGIVDEIKKIYSTYIEGRDYYRYKRLIPEEDLRKIRGQPIRRHPLWPKKRCVIDIRLDRYNSKVFAIFDNLFEAEWVAEAIENETGWVIEIEEREIIGEDIGYVKWNEKAYVAGTKWVEGVPQKTLHRVYLP